MSSIGKNLIRLIKTYVIALGIGFMLAWHNVYNNDERLTSEVKIEIVLEEKKEESAPE